jgi:hypothetical protein
MKMSAIVRQVSVLAIAALLSAQTAFAQGNALTIYSSASPGAIQPEQYRSGLGHGHVPGYAVVRHERDLALDKGKTTIRFTDVAAQIDPTTVSFESLTDPAGTRVLEQNYRFDLVNHEKLLQKYLDREISVEQVRGDKVETFTGILLSSSANGLILKSRDGSVHSLPYNTGVKLPHLQGGLITRPTLVWDVATDKAGPHRGRVS